MTTAHLVYMGQVLISGVDVPFCQRALEPTAVEPLVGSTR